MISAPTPAQSLYSSLPIPLPLPIFMRLPYGTSDHALKAWRNSLRPDGLARAQAFPFRSPIEPSPPRRSRAQRVLVSCRSRQNLAARPALPREAPRAARQPQG